MGIGDVIAIILIASIVGSAFFYLIKAKKKGQKCIGCPYASSCGKANKSMCNCSEKREESGER